MDYITNLIGSSGIARGTACLSDQRTRIYVSSPSLALRDLPPNPAKIKVLSQESLLYLTLSLGYQSFNYTSTSNLTRLHQLSDLSTATQKIDDLYMVIIKSELTAGSCYCKMMFF